MMSFGAVFYLAIILPQGISDFEFSKSMLYTPEIMFEQLIFHPVVVFS